MGTNHLLLPLTYGSWHHSAPAKEVIAWQNQLMAYRDKDGKGYSPDYLRSVHAQLSAIFNHAVKYYRLPVNPARTAGTLGKEIPSELSIRSIMMISVKRSMNETGRPDIQTETGRSKISGGIKRPVRRSR